MADRQQVKDMLKQKKLRDRLSSPIPTEQVMPSAIPEPTKPAKPDAAVPVVPEVTGPLKDLAAKKPEVPSYQSPYSLLVKAEQEKLDKLKNEAIAKPEVSQLDKLQSYISDKYKSLEEQDRAWIQDKKARFDSMYQEAKELKDQNVSRAQWAEVAETLANAFAQLGYGLSISNSQAQNVPALRNARADWDRRWSQINTDYRTNVEDIRRQESDVEDENKRAASLKREAADKDISLVTQNYITYKKDIESKKADLLNQEDRYTKALVNQGLDEQRARQAAQKKVAKESTVVKDAQASIAKINDAKSLLEQHEKAPKSKKAAIAARIFSKLPGAEKDYDEFQAAAEDRGSKGGWFSSVSPDKLKQYLDKMEQGYQQLIPGAEKVEEPTAPTGLDADKKKRLEELRAKAGK